VSCEQLPGPPVVTERDREMLRMAWRFGYLSRDQLKVLSGFGSVTGVNARCTDAVRASLLRRKRFPVLAGYGSAQSLY